MLTGRVVTEEILRAIEFFYTFIGRGEGERFAVQGCRDTGVINTDNQLDGGDRASNHQLHDSIRGISRYGERLFEAIDESRLADLVLVRRRPTVARADENCRSFMISCPIRAVEVVHQRKWHRRGRLGRAPESTSIR